MVERRQPNQPLVLAQRRRMPHRNQRRPDRSVRQDHTLGLARRSRTPEDHCRAKGIFASGVFGRGERLWVRREEDLPVAHCPATEVRHGLNERESRSAVVVCIGVDEEDGPFRWVAELGLQFGREELESLLEAREAGGGGDDCGGLGEGEDVGDFLRCQDGVGGRELRAEVKT